MQVNKELLHETLATIKADPQHWDQSTWHCQTSHCFAGLVECKLRNHPLNEPALGSWIIEDKAELKNILIINQLDDNDRLKELDACYFNEVNVSLLARIALGIGESEGFDLFDVDNTIKDLERIVEELCAQEDN